MRSNAPFSRRAAGAARASAFCRIAVVVRATLSALGRGGVGSVDVQSSGRTKPIGVGHNLRYNAVLCFVEA
jgi:hypothetical protein